MTETINEKISVVTVYNREKRTALPWRLKWQGRVYTITHLGYHPETIDAFFLPSQDRYAGLYVLGVQGVGKSSLLENLIADDIAKGHAVIVIDPHGDLVDHVIAQVPETDIAKEAGQQILSRMFLLDMQDEDHPFGVNVFAEKRGQTTIAQTQAVDRVMHIFEVLWGDVVGQQNLPRYLRATTIALFSNPGSTLVDMYDFLLDGSLREKMLANVADPTIKHLIVSGKPCSGPSDFP